MQTIIIILIAWYLKAFCDAMMFGKGGEATYEFWHFLDWARFWGIAGYLLYITYPSWKLIVILIVLSFLWNTLYKIFRALNVSRLDNKLRVKWLARIIDRGGII